MKAGTKNTYTSSCHHAQIQEFLSWGEGEVQARRPENSKDNVFILVLNLFYSLQRGSNGLITEKALLFQGSRGGPTFSRGGVQLFPGGKCILLAIFQGGTDPLSPPPLDQHMAMLGVIDICTYAMSTD